ncbi:unnamed protein product [Cylindrotheca closterium]|uniref:Uncharacterized protein n=1 Tax=Cylindrotheca closterium TaxID=2856 RepID=A0AAD2CRN2_9STRA|nr:unnamed protein product [Cylindrotheca closterium]
MASNNRAVSQKNNNGPVVAKPKKNSKRIHHAGGTATNDQKRVKFSDHLHEKENEAVAANAIVDLATGPPDTAKPPDWFWPAMTSLMGPIQTQLQTMVRQRYRADTRLTAVEALHKSQELRLYHIENRLHRIEKQQLEVIAQLNKVETQASDMADQLTRVEKYQYSMSYRLSNLIARQLNGGISKRTEPVYECWNHNWEVAESFPSTPEALSQMTELEMRNFLEHYDILPVLPSMEEQRRIIQRFLGIPNLRKEETPSTVDLDSTEEVPAEETLSTS